MNMITIGLLGVLLLFILFFIGVPVAYAMGIAGLVGLIAVTNFSGAVSIMSYQWSFSLIDSSYTVVPMFTLMGTLAAQCGITDELFEAFSKWFGRMRGGLATANIMAGAGFAAITGSTAASCAALSKIAVPQLRKAGYKDSLACACTAAAGSLGILIPPSGTLIVYGLMTEQSIGKLFIAGVIPGLCLAALYILAVQFTCLVDPAAGPAGERTTWREKIAALPKLASTLILFGLVIGGLFLGWFTPTQAGSVGVLGVIIVSLIKRKFTWKGFTTALRDTLQVTAMLMTLVIGANIFGRFIAFTGLPSAALDILSGSGLSPLMILIIILVVHFIGGFFMDAFALILITLPIVYPLLTSMGYDPIWFGVMVILIVEAGSLTPPVCMNVFVVQSVVKDVKVETIFRGIWPFVASLMIMIVLLVSFPILATLLPSIM